MKLNKITAGLLGLIAMGAPSTVHSKAIAAKGNIQTAAPNSEMKQGAEFNKKRKDSLPDMIGGHEMVNIGGYGIPPHIYGQNHVRKGTHRRTNK